MDQYIEELTATPKTLAHLVAECTDWDLDRAFRDDEYLCMRVALERMLAETGPLLTFMEGSDWELGRNRTRDRKEWLLGDFALQRQASLAILRGLRPEDRSRGGRTADGRQFTLEQFVQSWARHDAEHIHQLELALGETLEEVKARRAQMRE